MNVYLRVFTDKEYMYFNMWHVNGDALQFNLGTFRKTEFNLMSDYASLVTPSQLVFYLYYL